MINIITSFYIPKIFDSVCNQIRLKELHDCLNNNINNQIIEKIHLYLDDEDAHEYIKSLNSDKINIISIGAKPLYSDLFLYALEKLQNKICMITNSDIYLAECDNTLLERLNDNNTVFALTRYEYDMSCEQITWFCGSHDCFVFKSPINFMNKINNINHVQHHLGSENIICWELRNSNINLYNPCYQIKIVHLHKSCLRESDRIRIGEDRNYSVSPCVL
jgi:hypothetical protein